MVNPLFFTQNPLIFSSKSKTQPQVALWYVSFVPPTITPTKMKIRLHEIELGTSDPAKSKSFYNTILGLENSVDQATLNVFQSGVGGIDFNTSTHLSPTTAVVSFLTDNLPEVIERLSANGISFSEPKKSHLGMTSIEFSDPDGHLIRVNQPTEDSPTWLKV